MSITADRELYALESRSETFDITSVGSFVRDGESDLIDVGMGSLMDSVDGDEEATYGSLTETHDHKLNRQIGAVETEIRGEFTIDGKDDMLMVTGAMAETQAGGMVTAAGQSDDLIGISGLRLTLAGDLWIAGLFGMEEKIASGLADGILIEVSGLSFEREYLSSNYNGIFAYQNAAVTHTTAATTFFPMLKVVRGLRNQLPGSGAPEGEGSEPSPAAPPPAAGEGTDTATGGTDGVVNAGATGGGDATQGNIRAAANAGEGAPTGTTTNAAQASTTPTSMVNPSAVDAGKFGQPNAASTANAAQASTTPTSMVNPSALDAQKFGLLDSTSTANVAANAAQPGVDLANTASPSTWRAAERLAGLQNAAAADSVHHADDASTVAHAGDLHHADQASAGSQVDEMLAAAEQAQQGPRYGPDGRAVGPAMKGMTEKQVEAVRRGMEAVWGPCEWDPEYGWVAVNMSQGPARMKIEDVVPSAGSTSGAAGAFRPAGSSVEDAVQAGRPVVDQVGGAPPAGAQNAAADGTFPAGSQSAAGGGSLDDTTGDLPVSRYAGETPPAPGRDTLYKQSFGYKQHLESHGIDVEWRNGCWRPALEEGAPPPTIGKTEYVNGEWRIVETGAAASDVNPGALPGFKDFGGRDRETYQRIRRLMGLAEDPAGRIKTGEELAQELAEASRQATMARILGDSLEEASAHTPEVERALDRLQEASDAAARSDANKEWWDGVRDAASTADQKTADAGDKDLSWIARMDDAADGVSSVSPVAAEGLQKAVVQATDPAENVVFGVRNPAYQGGAHAASMRQVEKTLSGGDAAHLLPKASEASEQVGAVSVVRASDSMDEMRPRGKVVAGDEAKDVMARARQRISDLEDVRASAEGAPHGVSEELARTEDVVAAIDGALPQLRQAGDGLDSKMAAASKSGTVSDESSALTRRIENLKKRIGELKVIRDSEEGADKADINRRILRAEQSLAGLQKSLASPPPAVLARSEDVAGSNLHRASEGGKGSWQPSPSVASAADDGARRPPPSPQVDNLGAKWADSTDGATAASDGRPQNVAVDQTIVVQGADGTVRVDTVKSGGQYDNSDWLDELSNAAPPPGMAVGGGWKAGTQRPSRLQKLRAWFSSKAAQIRQWLRRGGSGAQSAGQASGGDSVAELGKVDGEIASDLETAAVLDSVPGKVSDQPVISPDAPPPSSLGGEDARQFQESLESAAPVNPGTGDALESPGDAAKGLDNSLELQQTSTFNVTFRAGDGAEDAGKAGDDAAGAGKAGGAAAGAGRLDESTLDVKKHIENWRKRAWNIKKTYRDTTVMTSQTATKSIYDVRDWSLDEIQRRITNYIRKSIDPDITDAKMGVFESDYEKAGYKNYHPTDRIHTYLVAQHELALASGDTSKAKAVAEALRTMSGYGDAARDLIYQMKNHADYIEPAKYNHDAVLRALRKHPDYVFAKHIAETGNVPDSVFDDAVAKLGRELTKDEYADLMYKYRTQGDVFRFAEQIFVVGGDARSMLHRTADTLSMRGMVDMRQVQKDQWLHVRDVVDNVVKDVCLKLTGKPPPEIENPKLFSIFSQNHKDLLKAEFDMVEGWRVIDLADDDWASGIIGSYYPNYASGGVRAESATDVGKLDAVTDSEAVVHGVSPDFPTVEVRAPDLPKAPDVPPPGAADAAFDGGKLDSVVDAGKVEDAAGALQTAYPKGVRDPQKYVSEFDKRIAGIHERQHSAVFDHSRRAIGTVMDVRNSSLDEMQKRITGFIKTHIDPSVTDEAMGIKGADYYKAAKPSDRHPVTDIFNYLKAQHAEAANAGDVNKANAAVEAMRKMSEYAAASEDMLAQKHLDTNIIDEPPYDPKIALDLLYKDEDFKAFDRFLETGVVPENTQIYRDTYSRMKIALSPTRRFNDYQMQQMFQLTAAHAIAYKDGEKALLRGEDARSVLKRYATSTDIGHWEKYMDSGYQYASATFEWKARVAYHRQFGTLDVPPAAFPRVFTEFSEADKAKLFGKFDQIDQTAFSASIIRAEEAARAEELARLDGAQIIGGVPNWEKAAGSGNVYLKSRDVPEGIRDGHKYFGDIDEKLGDIRVLQRDASADTVHGRRAAGTILEMQSHAFDVIQQRTTDFIRTHMDPNITNSAMGIRDAQYYADAPVPKVVHPINAISDWLKAKYAKAVEVQDAAQANAAAEGLRLMSEYLGETEKLMNSKFQEFAVSTRAAYDVPSVREAFLEDPGIKAIKEFSETSEVPRSAVTNREAVLGRKLTQGEKDELWRQLYNRALAFRLVEDSFDKGEDARGVMHRSTNFEIGEFSEELQSGYLWVRDRLDAIVDETVFRLTGDLPPPIDHPQIYSTFTEADRASLAQRFDMIDAFHPLDLVADQYKAMEDDWIKNVLGETEQAYDGNAFFTSASAVDSQIGLDPLPVPQAPKAADMAAENRGWAAAWRNLQVKDAPASLSERLRDAPTVSQVRNFFYKAASERIAKMAADVDPSFTREAMAGDAGSQADQLKAMRQFLVRQQRTAVLAGDAEKARDLGEILRRSTGYLVESDNALTRLLADISAPQQVPYSTSDALEEVRRNPFYLMAMGYSRKIELPDEIKHKVAAWDEVVGALQSGADPRADVLRRVDGYNFGLVDSIERDAYEQVAKAFDGALQEVVGEGQPLPPVAYDGKMFSVFDDAARRSLAEAFDAIDGGKTVAHPDTPDDLFSVGFGDLLVMPPMKAAEPPSPQVVDDLTSPLPTAATAAARRAAEEAHLDAWRNALKAAANQDPQPVVYLETGSVAPVYAGDGGRSALEQIMNPLGARQLSPYQRSIAMRFNPSSPHARKILRRLKMNHPVDPVHDMRFLFQDPGDLVPNAAEGGMWDHRLTEWEIQRYVDEPHASPRTKRPLGTSPKGREGRWINPGVRT